MDPTVDLAHGKPKIVKDFLEPTSRTASSAEFVFPEFLLPVNSAFYFHVPKDLTQRSIDYVKVAHRQDPSINKKRSQNDEKPGLTALLVLGRWNSEKDEWRIWKGVGKEPWNSKFAEPRASLEETEIDTWFDWGTIGHCSLEKADCSTAGLKPTDLMLVSTGKEPVLISAFSLGVSPLPSSRWQTEKYNSAVIVGDPVTQRGVFTIEESSLKSGLELSVAKKKGKQAANPASEVSIALENQAALRSVELYLGDSKFGRGRLDIIFVRADGEELPLLKDANIAPLGNIFAYPPTEGLRTGTGDRLILRAVRDKLYLQAARIGYE